MNLVVGQLVVYPMLDLSKPQYRKDLHWYLRNIEQVILDTLADFGIDDCRRDEENIGIWVGEGKIAAIGVHASSWITMHGFAINVHPDLSYYDEEIIIPCGLKGKPVTSMEKETGKKFTIDEVAHSVTRNFGNVFNVEIENCEPLL
jgi:lipoate-protein ligase B